MLGNLCTRRCGFCAVPKGRPEPIDFDEPRRVAEAVAKLGLLHAVVTSVNRDDDNLGGARAFALVIDGDSPPGARLPRRSPHPRLSGRPRIHSHRRRSAPRGAQPQYRIRAAPLSRGPFRRALRADASSCCATPRNLHPTGVTKSGVMVGLGEETAELLAGLSRSRRASAATFSPSASICAPRATICRWHASTRRASSPSSKPKRSRWASATSSPARWCARAITRTSRLCRQGSPPSRSKRATASRLGPNKFDSKHIIAIFFSVDFAKPRLCNG